MYGTTRLQEILPQVAKTGATHIDIWPRGHADQREQIEAIGPKLVHFYAWQHGQGCHKKLPKAEELEQMPGRGSLDFGPLLAALKKINYSGWTETISTPSRSERPTCRISRSVVIIRSAGGTNMQAEK